MAIDKVKLPDNSVEEVRDSRIPGIDSAPTANSTNLVTSGGVKGALDGYLPLTGGTMSGALALNYGVPINFKNSAGDVLGQFGMDSNYYPQWFRAGTSSRIWTADNDGDGSGLDADLLDGWHGERYVLYNEDTLGDNVDFNEITYKRGNSIVIQPIHVSNYSGQTNMPFTGYGQMLTFGGQETLFPFRIAHSSSHSKLFYNSAGYKTTNEYNFSGGSGWREIAFTTSNVASADYAASAGLILQTDKGSWDADNLSTNLAWFYGQVGGVSNFVSGYGGYGGLFTFHNGALNGSLSGQLAWTSIHDSQTPTDCLFWRSSGNLGWGSDWKQVLLASKDTTSNVGSLTLPGIYRIDMNEGRVSNYANILVVRGRDSDTLAQMSFDYYSNGHTYIRSGTLNDIASKSWERLALTSDNVASANKLATSRSIWGQNFDGTGDVNGDFFFNGGDGTLKIYAIANPLYSSDYGPESVAIQTTFDQQDPETSDYPALYTGRNALLLQPRGGYVGIGTPSPEYKLDVNGDTRATNLLATGNLSALSCGIGLINIPSGQNVINSSQGYPLHLNYSYSDNISLCYGGGNVGIGTTIPATKLDVNGILSATAGLFGGANGVNIGATYAGSPTSAYDLIERAQQGGTLYFQFNHAGSISMCQGGGNVGINTSSPAYKLHVNGDAYVSGGFKGETLFIQGSYTDPAAGLSCAIKASGNVAVGGDIIASGSGNIKGESVTTTLQSSQPSDGMLPNRQYAFGELSGDTTFSMAAGVSSNTNHYFWTFSTPSTAPTITWPAAITSWYGGSAPTINASKHYEVSVLDGVAICMEV